MPAPQTNCLNGKPSTPDERAADLASLPNCAIAEYMRVVSPDSSRVPLEHPRTRLVLPVSAADSLFGRWPVLQIRSSQGVRSSVLLAETELFQTTIDITRR